MVSGDLGDPLTLSIDALVRSIGVNRGVPHAFFLGAGASITSGVPSATDCVWRWKRDSFLTANPGMERFFCDVSLPTVRERIQRWLEAERLVPPADADDYGFYAERCYPIAQDRRQFFQALAEGTTPSVGYQLLALLAHAGIVTSVWTTNFDGLVARAAADLVTCIDVGLDTAERVVRQARRGELLSIALHGDFRYDNLKNTPAELKEQDRALRDALIQRAVQTTLVVSGYSGRDESVMAALGEAYARPGTGRLYWCGHEAPEPSGAVRELIESARRNGRDAFYVPTHGFDDLLGRLALHCLTDDHLSKARALFDQARASSEAPPPPFIAEPGSTAALIKSNALEIACPGDVLQFDARGFDSPGAWARLREITAGTKVEAVLQRRKVLAMGTIHEVRAAFGDRIVGEVERAPITAKDLAMSDGVVISLLTRALVRAVACARGLNTDGRDLLWEPKPGSERTVAGARCRIHDAAVLCLRRHGDRQYLVIKPTIRGTTATGEALPLAIEQELKRVVLTPQYNQAFNDALERWRQRLFEEGAGDFEFPPRSGSSFRFKIARVPAFAQIAALRPERAIVIPEQARRHIRHQGVQYEEPQLLFSNLRGDGFVPDAYPIRGLRTNRPYDYALSRHDLGQSVSVGIVCPAPDAARVSAFVRRLHDAVAVDSKDEYLLDYPGYSQAFGLSVDLPQPGDRRWRPCPEPPAGSGTRDGATVIAQHLTRAIDALAAAASPHVILVYMPERWREWERFEADGERFDLHDFVKAYGIQRGIATQFLREATLGKGYLCEIVWWLALSFYVKAMRTPWVLDGLDADTAFLGLGFVVDPRGGRSGRMVLGCSHIYNAEGLGLRYKLSKIEEPLLLQDNPHMSRADARRMGDSVRQLFVESLFRLPRRVVIHKRTPFLPEERIGLLEGLKGVEVVDMLEITVDPMLRFVASKVVNGRFEGDGFPVRRGTAVVLDWRRALLWVHGTAAAITPNRKYYLGKSRIPAPLVITRHHGPSSLGVLAREILGLSKMNWNTLDLYTKLPATIQSSNEIARIGVLLERFGPLSYDYRLFI